MATLEQLSAALQAADAAGNVDDAKALAGAIRQIQQQGAPAETAREGPLGEFGQSHAGQAISGANEGIANLLGAPVSLVNDWVIGPAMAGVNAVAGTDFKPSEKPFLGQEMMRDMLSPTIAPPTQDSGKQMVRRIGQELGATMIPGGGMAARSAAPLRMLAGELLGATGSGAGAAVAQQVAPGNPMAEMVASLVGGFAPMAGASMLRRGAARQAAPSADDLEAQKAQAYQQADSLGVRYTPQAVRTLNSRVDQAVRADNISPTRHPRAFSFVEDMQKRGANGYTLTELDQLRQEVRRDLLRASDEAERHFGGIILDEIDAAIAKAGPGDVSSGSATAGNQAILAARELNTRWRKTEVIEDALYAANLKAASSGSGGNQNNAIRQAFRSILLSPRRRQGFTAEEISQMERIVKQGAGDEALRLIGKLSPEGNGLMLALGIGGTAINPAMAGFSAAGALAKRAADWRTASRAANLRADVARGGQAQLPPLVSPGQPQMAQALLMGQVANQNDTDPLATALLRARALN